MALTTSPETHFVPVRVNPTPAQSQRERTSPRVRRGQAHHEPLPQIDDAVARSILDATDIVSIIGEVVDLAPRGKEFVGLCPFHNDTHPSMSVSGEKGVYQCWVCSAGQAQSRGGDVVTFVRRYFNIGYPQAMRYLAERAGIRMEGPAQALPKVSRPKTSPDVRKAMPAAGRGPNPNANKAKLLEITAQAQGVFHQCLQGSPEALDYLLRVRNVAPGVLARYPVGFASSEPFELSNALKKQFQNDDLIDAGLAVERLSKKTQKPYLRDFFNHRIMFGIQDEKGNVVGFGARRMPEQDGSNDDVNHGPKYINTPETAVFVKGDVPYGLPQAKNSIISSGYAFVLEGYLDVLALASHGIENVVASMGTSLTAAQAQRLLALAPRIVMCLDGDTAGQQAMLRSLITLMPLVKRPDQLAFVSLPAGQDPDVVVRAEGRNAFLARVPRALGIVGFIHKMIGDLNVLEPEEQKKQLEVLKGLAKAMGHLPNLQRELLTPYLTQPAPEARPTMAPARSHAQAPSTLQSPWQQVCSAAQRDKAGARVLIDVATRWAQSQELADRPAFVQLIADLRAALDAIDPTLPSERDRMVLSRAGLPVIARFLGCRLDQDENRSGKTARPAVT